MLDCDFVLLYHYYGGLVFAALKRFDDSMQCFFAVCPLLALFSHQGMCLPSEGPVSAISVACFHRLLLTSLIHLGELPPLPKARPFLSWLISV